MAGDGICVACGNFRALCGGRCAMRSGTFIPLDNVDFSIPDWQAETYGQAVEKAKVRTFESGATRDTDDGKLDYDGFLSPLVLRRYAEYMHKNRVQSDGTLRASDNWQKGIPREAYMKSMWRHFMDVWDQHHWEDGARNEALCALLFNVMGYLHENQRATRVLPLPAEVYEVVAKEPIGNGDLVYLGADGMAYKYKMMENDD